MQASFAALSIACLVVGYLDYFRDIFKGQSQPHAYTWLIWALTQGTATAASWYGGGGVWAVASIGAGAALVVVIFMLSLRYGTRNITRGDTIVFIAALAAVYVWWGMHQPLLAVVMVSLIDGIGYWPTWRKTYEEPGSESLFFWILMATSVACIIAASESWNFLTILYPATLAIANSILVGIIVMRRAGA